MKYHGNTELVFFLHRTEIPPQQKQPRWKSRKININNINNNIWVTEYQRISSKKSDWYTLLQGWSWIQFCCADKNKGVPTTTNIVRFGRTRTLVFLEKITQQVKNEGVNWWKLDVRNVEGCKFDFLVLVISARESSTWSHFPNAR